MTAVPSTRAKTASAAPVGRSPQHARKPHLLRDERIQFANDLPEIRLMAYHLRSSGFAEFAEFAEFELRHKDVMRCSESFS